MKLLLAIKGCERDASLGLHQAIRETWGANVNGADLRFFVGRGNRDLCADEIRVECGDDYMSLPAKTRAILRWFLDRDYDFIWLGDTDTYVVPERLLTSGFENYDLTGLFNGPIGVPRATEGDAGPWKPSDQSNGATRYWAWISGGNGYWLSRCAAQVVVESETHYSADWAEDRTVGQVLGPYFQRGELRALNHDDYGFVTDSDEYLCRITRHFCTRGMHREFNKAWMYACHARNSG